MKASLHDMLLLVFVLGFLLGIRLMNSPKTAVKGNLLGAFCMLCAIAVTLVSRGIVSYRIVWVSMAVGGLIGYGLAARAAMILMPQLVALLNGLGGGASAVTAFIVLGGAATTPVTGLTGGLALLVGGVTFSGSMVAAGKLHRIIRQQPIILKGHTALSIVIASVMGCLLVLTTVIPGNTSRLPSLLSLLSAVLFGIIFTVRIGGADMPITISLLNSCSGIAGSIAGFAIRNPLLVAVGAIVGAAGLILTRIMCHAMNRTLLEIVLGGTTAAQNTRGTVREQPDVQGDKETALSASADVMKRSPESVVTHLLEARNVVIVPGYGMALSQAQNEVKELCEKLRGLGKDVKFAIHPVAGRMPGHMNVLLAEVDIPYDRLFEMDAINPEFINTDTVVIVGANDVVNPAATSAEGTPIYGMPILTVFEAKHVIVCNLDTQPGYAGVDNPLYKYGNVVLLLGDAKETVGELSKLLEMPADDTGR